MGKFHDEGVSIRVAHDERMRHLERVVDQMAVDMVALRSDTNLAPRMELLLDVLRDVPRKLESHELGIKDLQVCQDEQSSTIADILSKSSTVEKQVEKALLST